MLLYPPSALLRGAFAVARHWCIDVQVVSDADLLARWREGLPHPELILGARPADGARIICVGRRDAPPGQDGHAVGTFHLWLLRAALHNAPGTSRRRLARAFASVALVLAAWSASDASGAAVVQLVALDMVGQPVLVLEQRPHAGHVWKGGTARYST